MAWVPSPLQDTVTVQAGDDLVNAHRLDQVAFPGLEALAAAEWGIAVTVWGLFSWPTTNCVRGVAWRRDGRPHVGLNVATTQCPLIRLGTFAHELRHVERGDLDRPGPEAEREADCRAAGADLVRAAVVGVNRKAGGPLVDADRCVQCYGDSGTPCPQGGAVFDHVHAALGPLTRSVPV